MSVKIKQEIEFRANFDYFAGFINFIIKKANINANVEFENKKIVLKIDEEDEKKVEDFSNIITKYLPHSLFLGEIDTKTCKEELSQDDFCSQDYEIAPCNFCIEELSNPKGSHYLDDEYKCKHYSNKGELNTKDNLTYSLNYSKDSILLLANTSKFDEYFIATNDEKKALFSIEKPTIKLTIKDEELKKLTSKNYIFVKAPWSIKSILASIDAKESGFDYLFFNDFDDLKAIVIKQNISFIKATRLLPPLKNFHKDKTINRFLNVLEEAGYDQGIGIYLNQEKISFLIKNEVGVKEVLKIDNFDNLEVFEKFKADEARSKLLDNFKNKHSKAFEKMTANKLSFFEVIGAILEIDGNFNEVSDKSLEFLGNGGLKIDFGFKDEEFDYVALLGSLMSFRLAGAEKHYLAYSFFEGFGDFATNITSQLKTKFKIKNTTFFGNMLLNNVLYSRILSKNEVQKPYFAKLIAFDE